MNKIKKYSSDEIMSLLTEEGYSAEQKSKQLIGIKKDGLRYGLVVHEDGDLMAVYSESGVKIKLNDINDWNKKFRLSRAYLDSKNDPVLTSDLMANAGLNREQIVAFLSIFFEFASIFRKMIAFKSISAIFPASLNE